MQLFERARRYGVAVQVLDEFLGEAMRDQVMEHFAETVQTAPRRGMAEPWEFIAQAALKAGVERSVVEALHLVYLARTGRREAAGNATRASDEAVLDLLSAWRVFDEVDDRGRRFRM